MVPTKDADRAESLQQRQLTTKEHNKRECVMDTMLTSITAAEELVAAESETTGNTKRHSSGQRSTCVGQNCELSLARSGSDANSLAARALHMSCTWF
jgi:hypothetical protein